MHPGFPWLLTNGNFEVGIHPVGCIPFLTFFTLIMNFTSEQLTLFAKADVYQLLSMAFLYPESKVIDNILSLSSTRANTLEQHPEFSEYARYISNIHSIVSSMSEVEIRREFTNLFVRGIVPMSESSCTREMNALADVSAYYAAFGVMPKEGESPESLPYQLEFASVLLLKAALSDNDEQYSVTLEAYTSFLHEHLSPFVAGFQHHTLQQQAGEPYHSLTAVLVDLIHSEVGDFAQIPLNVLDNAQPWAIDSYLSANNECALSPEQAIV